jgi:dipeptidyl aminopeptidase/acylaminoacyl peptidase
MVAVDGGAAAPLTTHRDPAPYWEDTRPVWSPDGKFVAYSDRGHVEVARRAGGPPVRLVAGHSPVWIDADHLLALVDGAGRTRLAVVDIHDPWPRPITSGDSEPSEPSVAGGLVAFTHSPPDDRKRRDIRVVVLATGEERTVSGSPGLADHGPAVSPDGSTVAFVSERSGRRQIHLVGADGANERRLTSASADFSAMAWHPGGERIAAVLTNEGVDALVVVDALSGEVEVVADGGVWGSPGWLPSGAIVASHESHAIAPRIVVVVPGGGVTVLVDGTPASVAAAPHVSPEHVWFPSRDGMMIPAFLFRPAMADEGPVGAVVYPHGGPTSHYGDEWDGYAQYFLDKGYAWLAINFRGSTSYGFDFERANHGQWGVTDTGDCLAAADYLETLDWVDGDRIAIFGASYGSYMALACLVEEPHRFACGVAKYGDCDPLTSWAQGDVGGAEDLERMMGHPGGNREAYRAAAPIHRIDRIDRPILVVHGEQDERVHPKQSKQLVDRLKALGKAYEYVTYPTEAHGLLRRGPQLHFYRRLERFLDWHLMGPPETSHTGPPPLGA